MKKLNFLLFPLATILVLFLVYNLYYWNKIFPGIYINNISLGGKTIEEGQNLLTQKINSPDKISLSAPNQQFEIQLSDIDFQYNYPASILRAYHLYRTGNLFYDFYHRIKAPFVKQKIGLLLSIDEDKLSTNLAVIIDQVSEEAQPPTITLNGNTVAISPGKLGKTVDMEQLRTTVGQSLTFNNLNPIQLQFVNVGTVLTDEKVTLLKNRAQNLLGKTITLKSDSPDIVFNFSDLVKTLSPDKGYVTEQLSTLVNNVATSLNRVPQNSVFTFVNNRVTEFQPSVNGLTVKQDILQNMLIQDLQILEESDTKNVNVDVPFLITPAKIQTKDVNNLGITELIGRGNSKFAHSIENRVFNIKLAASKFKGILVAPGDTFSFNDVLGDVSSLTGYEQAYIIKEGRTVLGDGGGVCQVSTTLFRAALNAGLPIVERIAHAYRVGYYEEDSPPGFDATVYAPLADLKIKNNTPAYILIQSTFDAAHLSLSFEIYGTPDGRKVTLTKPVVSDQVAPPPDLYQDDPTLPMGQIKQVDFSAWGARVEFNYQVTLNGQVLTQQKFVSNYHPWQAVFLRGTAI
jgi:vancomycin resistance protein YoaR